MMKKKIIGILFCMLLITTILVPIASTINIKDNKKDHELEDDSSTNKNTKFSLFPNIPRLFNRDWNYWASRPNLIMIPDGNVGIGTSEPEGKLHMADYAGIILLHIQNTKTTGSTAISLNKPGQEWWLYLDSYDNFKIYDRTKHKAPVEIEEDCQNNLLFLKSPSRVGINTRVPATTLDVKGGFSTRIRTSNYDTQAQSTDHTILVNTSERSIIVELPSASTAEGQILVIKKIDYSGHKVKIKPAESEEIERLSETYIARPHHSIMIQSDGHNWWVIADYKL